MTCAVLAIVLLRPAKAENFNKETIKINAPDSVIIVADVITLSHQPGPSIMALHNYGGNRDDWNPYLEYFARAGIAKIITVDFPGHGESVVRRKNGDAFDTISHEQFSKTDYAGIVEDIDMVFNFFRKIPGVDSLHCGIIGSRMGAVYAAKTAAKNKSAAFLVLIEPAPVYRGVAINEDIRHLRNLPVLFVSSDVSELEFATSQWLFKQCSSNFKENKIFRQDIRADRNIPETADFISRWLGKIK
jgi:pimeloyl-ACP methyl ester carboxylesterase